MQEIKCPKCGEVFQIDEAGYAEIVKQVRTREFNDELQRQKSAMDSEKKMAVELAVTQAKSEKDDEIAKRRGQTSKSPCRKKNRNSPSSKAQSKAINQNLSWQ